jgi:DNA-binding XRE family transcriptional regulator
MAERKIPSLSMDRDLRSLGENISVARRRRKLTQSNLADAAGVTRATIRRLEKGEAGITIGTLAMVLLALGERDGIRKLVSPERDLLGQALSIDSMPKRIRSPRKAKKVETATPLLDGIVTPEGYMAF